MHLHFLGINIFAGARREHSIVSPLLQINILQLSSDFKKSL